MKIHLSNKAMKEILSYGIGQTLIRLGDFTVEKVSVKKSRAKERFVVHVKMGNL